MVHSDGENEGVPRLIYPLWAVKQSNVTGSERTGLITHFKAQRNDGFNNSVCYNSPMAEVTT